MPEDMPFPNLQPGLEAEYSLRVEAHHTAAHLGSGGVQVLATPELIRMMERAAVLAVDHLLPAGFQTVGVHVDVSHIAATPLGLNVRAHARLVQVDGRRLTFEVEAFDDLELVGTGTHQRMIIALERFQERVSSKQIRAGCRPA